MEPRHQKIDLIKSADTCEEHLNRLKKHASDLKTQYTIGKKHILLEDVVTRSNTHIQSLKAWTAAIGKGRQTSDEEIKASIDAVFGNIVSRVADAKEALDHRLRLGLWASEKTKYAITQARLCTQALADIAVEKQTVNVFTKHSTRSLGPLDTCTIRSRQCYGILQIRKSVKKECRKSFRGGLNLIMSS